MLPSARECASIVTDPSRALRPPGGPVESRRLPSCVPSEAQGDDQERLVRPRSRRSPNEIAAAASTSVVPADALSAAKMLLRLAAVKKKKCHRKRALASALPRC